MFNRISDFIKLFREAITGEEREYTSGSIDRAILLLSIPMVLEMLMEGLFALVDIFYASRLGKEATATIGLTEVMTSQVMAIAFGLSMAVTAMVSRRIGEKDKEGAALAAVQAIFLGLVICIVFGTVFFFIAEDILEFMGGSPELVEKGTPYTRILLTCSGSVFFLFLLNAVFRGAGNAAIAMRTLWIANGINIIIVPLLMFPWGPFEGLGLKGAAIGTTIGRTSGVLYQLYHLTNGKHAIHLQRRHFIWVGETILKLVRVSTTGVLQFFMATASWFFIVKIIAAFGDAVTAGYSIGIRVVIFTMLPAWGMASAASTLVGQNLGANQPERAEQSVWRTGYFNMLFLGSISVIFIIAAPWIIDFFTNDPEVLSEGIHCLRTICFGYVFYAYGMVMGQAINGAGDTVTPTILNFIAFWLLQIPLSWILGRTLNFGPAGVYWAIAISESILALISILVFRRGKWKTVQI